MPPGQAALSEKGHTMASNFLGTWLLKRFVLETPIGEPIYPLGENPIGISIFDSSRYMSAQLCQRDRPHFASESPALEEFQTAFATYIAYYGRYTVDEKKKTLTTHVQGASNPDWVGEDQLRYYDLSGEKLVLKTNPLKIKALGDLEVIGCVTWEKAGDT